MKEKRKIEVLSLIREMHDQGVHPTLSDAGLTVEEAQELASESLVSIGDKTVGEPLERYVVFELSPKAIAFLTTKKAHRRQHIVSHTPARSLSEKIGSATAKKLWDLSWDAGKVASGFLLGWWLKRYFPH